MSASELPPCAGSSAHLPASARAAWHAEKATILEGLAAGEPCLGSPPDEGLMALARDRAREHRLCAAMFAPCEGTRGGPADG